MAQGHKPAGSSDGGQFTRSTKGASPQRTMEDIRRELGSPRKHEESAKEYYDRILLMHAKLREIREEEERTRILERREELETRMRESEERARALDKERQDRIDWLLASAGTQDSTSRRTGISSSPELSRPPLISMEEDIPVDRERCHRCGQFMAQTGHRCPKIPFKHKAFFAVSLGGTMAVTAGAIALGPVGIAAVVTLGVAGYAVKRFFARFLMLDKKQREEAERLKETSPEWATADTMVQQLKKELDVEGEVLTVPKKVTTTDGQPLINAAAVRTSKDHAIVFLSPELLAIPVEQQKGIIAHELAHLQKNVTGRGYHRLRSVALPVAVVGGAVSGLALLPAAAVAGVTWFMVVMAANAAGRMEERRADREAYRIAGDHFGEALHTVHDAAPDAHRRNLIWRLEDMLFTHGALPNRLKDMTKRSKRARGQELKKEE